MIHGIGTDICDIRRIEAVYQRQGERFVRKVLSDAEFVVWQKRSARLRPRLAASAVDRVVLGPGEKLIAVQNSSRAVSSGALMVGKYPWGRLSAVRLQCNLRGNTRPIQINSAVANLYRS